MATHLLTLYIGAAADDWDLAHKPVTWVRIRRSCFDDVNIEEVRTKGLGQAFKPIHITAAGHDAVIAKPKLDPKRKARSS